MGMTITEKILAKAAGEKCVHPGQLIMADLSMVLGTDITSPVAITSPRTKTSRRLSRQSACAALPVSTK